MNGFHPFGSSLFWWIQVHSGGSGFIAVGSGFIPIGSGSFQFDPVHSGESRFDQVHSSYIQFIRVESGLFRRVNLFLRRFYFVQGVDQDQTAYICMRFRFGLPCVCLFFHPSICTSVCLPSNEQGSVHPFIRQFYFVQGVDQDHSAYRVRFGLCTFDFVFPVSVYSSIQLSIHVCMSALNAQYFLVRANSVHQDQFTFLF